MGRSQLCDAVRGALHRIGASLGINHGGTWKGNGTRLGAEVILDGTKILDVYAV